VASGGGGPAHGWWHGSTFGHLWVARASTSDGRLLLQLAMGGAPANWRHVSRRPPSRQRQLIGYAGLGVLHPATTVHEPAVAVAAGGRWVGGWAGDASRRVRLGNVGVAGRACG
jgi:hypothetical protein